MTIRQAINNGAKIIYLNNGVCMRLPDLYEPYEIGIQPPKIIKGKPVYRWLFFSLFNVDKHINLNLSAIKHRSVFNEQLDYCYFHKNDYIAKEKEVNRFISDNGGINYYI